MIMLLNFFFSSQIFWPASANKVEECKMAGKDPTVSYTLHAYSHTCTSYTGNKVRAARLQPKAK